MVTSCGWSILGSFLLIVFDAIEHHWTSIIHRLTIDYEPLVTNHHQPLPTIKKPFVNNHEAILTVNWPSSCHLLLTNHYQPWFNSINQPLSTSFSHEIVSLEVNREPRLRCLEALGRVTAATHLALRLGRRGAHRSGGRRMLGDGGWWLKRAMANSNG